MQEKIFIGIFAFFRYNKTVFSSGKAHERERIREVYRDLDEKDKQILQMRQDGYTYKEIAERVGFKTHSAVGKRINKIGRMYENYSGLNFGF